MFFLVDLNNSNPVIKPPILPRRRLAATDALADDEQP